MAIRPLRFYQFAAMLAVAFGGLVLAADNTPSQSDLQRLSDTIARVEEQLSSASGERETQQQALFDLEKEITGVLASITRLDQQISTQETQLATLEAEAAELERQKQLQAETIARYLRSAWQSGSQEYLKLLLNQKDLAESSRMQRYYSHFNQARADRISQFTLVISELERNSREISALNLELRQDQEKLGRNYSELQDIQARRETQLAELENFLKEGGQELARLNQEREELALLIQELNQSIASLQAPSTGTSFNARKGNLPWPVEGPLLNTFGSRHELGDVTWQGVNIQAPAGEQVKAVHSGRVVFSDWFGNSGLLLIIDHGDGFMSLYAQNQQLLRGVGDWVNSGDIIAAVGNTGGREEPALYFEIRRSGRSEDPVAWCSPRR